jgi:hypothetical protein
MAAYETVFALSDVRYAALPYVLGGLGFVAIGVGLVVFPRGGRHRAGRWIDRGFGVLFLAFSLFWTCAAFLGSYADYRRVADAVADGRFHLVEGRVHDFRPMPVHGHALEHFCVQQACFAYSDFEASPGFNRTSSHGGPIREGLAVRVAHVGNTIVRLEVEKPRR